MIDSDPLLFIAKLTWLKLHKLDIVKDTDVIIMKNNMGKPLFHRMEFWRRVIGKYMFPVPPDARLRLRAEGLHGGQVDQFPRPGQGSNQLLPVLTLAAGRPAKDECSHGTASGSTLAGTCSPSGR